MYHSSVGSASSSTQKLSNSRHPTPRPSALSLAPAPTHSASHDINTREDARVVVLLNGRRVKFNDSFTSSGKLGGTLASLTVHDQILRFVSEKEGRASQGLVLFFGSEERLSFEMGEEKARLFVQSFNSTEGFASAFVDVGTRDGAAEEAICTHFTFHLASSDYLILGGINAESFSRGSKLESAFKKAAQGRITHKLTLLKLEDHAEAMAREMGVQVVSFGDVLEARLGREATPPAPSHTAPATLEGIVRADAGWGDPLAMLASSQAGPSTAPRAMKTHPTTFAKARPIPTPSPRPPPAARPPLSAPAPARPTSAPAAPSHSSNPSSTPSQPAKDSPWIFFPLTKLLHEQKAAGFPRPLRSHVGGLLTKSKKGRYALNKYGGFREYAKAAQRKGLVEMGVESLGKEWIALKE